MSLEVFQRALHLVLESRFAPRRLHILWHAGEPLAMPVRFYEDAFTACREITERFPNLSVHHSIQTNGTLLSDAWCQLFVRHSVHVGVSVDGPAFLHDRRRRTRNQKETHAKVMDGIQILQRNNMPFSVISVLSHEALQYPDTFFAFYRLHGIQNIGFNVDEISSINRNSELVIPDEQIEESYRSFLSRIWELSKGTQFSLTVREFQRFKRRILLPTAPDLGNLSHPFAVMSVDWQGNFSTFCPELLNARTGEYPDGFTVGNVLTDTLEDALASPKFQQIAAAIDMGIQKCSATCDYFGVCGGGAPSNKLFEKGSFSVAETQTCRLTRKIPVDILLESLERDSGIRQA